MGYLPTELVMLREALMNIGFTELLVILVIVLVLFGAGKLPKAMGQLGEGLKHFRKGLNEKDNDATATKNDPLPPPQA